MVGMPNTATMFTNQREAADLSTRTLVAAIVENLDIDAQSPATSSFRIADLGCSTGPNTFFAINNIIEAVAQKYQLVKGHSAHLPEIQVYCSDLVSNDFNHLFANLPQDRRYFAAAVPGSFHGRLFPKASLDFVYSEYALQWLSKVPPETLDSNSPAFNKGRIMHEKSAIEVVQAFSDQYAKDMQCFFDARAQELAPGGLLLMLIPGRPGATLPAQHPSYPRFEPLESSLSDMVNEGLIGGEKFDSFNLPIYSPSVEEPRKIIENSECFDVLRLETQPERQIPLCPEGTRAGCEKILTEHFGSEIIEPLFDRYSKKVQGRSPINSRDGYLVGLFVLLKRRP
ncbi:PREDICTED: probable S-adenosylmethionine-dependent methyltransferase At5g37990 [Fragaria vesca subsp. vesca]|uniref:probable S-adenosylmethionine-dependent methyltransferase At5g37990 n=1 Tax=Fragaria vesca subsp. vesca TaxID=101020 RepID=UPI0002C2F911|nr:PREDICTED: probable S-adenosylmethionine-dependent methyltransferase At5g37990 [Fragaria vesca subsp. vesca]